jgi:ABC-type polysaccharide/polyol phosphate export permease
MKGPPLKNTINMRRRLATLSTVLAVVLLFGLAAVSVDWVGTYLLPVVVAFVVLVVSLGLLAGAIITLYNKGNKIS